MNYVWTECPGCRCQITIQFTESAGRLTGSVRRWSRDRSVNDGRLLEVLRSAVAADGGFEAPCVCGATIAVAGASIEHAATEA